MPHSNLKPIKLYYLGGSPNPWKVAFILSELGVPYELELVQMANVKKEPFISVNPNGRCPAIIDPNKGITLWESGAIVDYLIDVYDTEYTLQYTSFPEKHLTRCWEHFQTSGQGPYYGQKGWFEIYHQEKLPSAIERYANEVRRIITVLDTHLEKQGTDYLVGDKITYADIMFIPYAHAHRVIFAPEIDIAPWKKYSAWLERMLARPAVMKVMEVWTEETRKFTESAGHKLKS